MRTYLPVIILLHFGFAGVFFFLNRASPSRFSKLFAWSWAIEAVRAAILLPEVHRLGGRAGEWFCLADILCFFANWCLFAGCADLAEARLPAWLRLGYFWSGIPLVVFGRYGLPLLLQAGLGWSWQQGRFYGVLANLVLMFLPVAVARLAILVWLVQIWNKTRLAGAGLAALFCVPYAIIALAVPVQFYYSYNPEWVDFVWTVRVFGFSIGLVLLVLSQQQLGLQQSEAGLAAAQALVKLGSWERDLSSPTATWSAEMYRLYGRDPSLGPMTAAESQAAVHLADREEFARQEAQLLAEKRPIHTEFRIVRPDGRVRWVAGNSYPVCDASGTVVRLAGTIQDITERKQDELRIRHLNRVLAVLSDLNQTIVRVSDLQGVFAAACRIAVEKGGFCMAWVGLVNSQTGQIEVAAQAGADPGGWEQLGLEGAGCGLQRAHAVCNDIEHDPRAAPWREQAKRLGYRACAAFPLTVGGLTRGTFQLYAGEPGWFDDEELRLLDELALDISFAMEIQQREAQRQRAEEELRWRTAFFEAQVESAVEGILVADSQGKTILQNRQLIEMLRIPPVVADAPHCADLLRFIQGRVKAPRPFVEMGAHLAACPGEVGELEVELLDGTIVELHSAPVNGSDGRHYGRVWTFRDVSKSRKLEEQVRQSQKMEAIGQLAGGVAHDFNNILGVILMQSEMLKGEAGVSLGQLGWANDIGRAAQRGADLTRQLLLFSRRQVPQERDLDLNEVVSNLTRMLGRIIGEDIHLQLKYEPRPLLIRADAGMVDQVLTNLVINSRDAMPKGGSLVIETASVELDELAVSQCPQARAGTFACLSVSDTGSGIPPEILPRIFEPFFTTKDVGRGTGLGLATVFGIVQQHSGWINVYSQLHHGTTFRVYFPCLARGTVGLTPAPPPATLRGGTETILLVEDDASLRAVVRAALARLGYHVLEAPTGTSALEVWKQHHHKIRLLLTDLLMPEGLNGKELAQRLLEDNPNLKVLYTSGYTADIAGKEFPLQEGVNFLAKPFAIHRLAQTLRDCLEKN
jgi:signal transduction histidine kinase/ActR/RegA family two-component response regulator